MTMTLVETITVGSGGAASIEFTGIPGDGKDLVLLLSTRQDSFSHNQIMGTFNNDAGNNYHHIELKGSGSSASTASYTLTSFRIPTASPTVSQTANTFGSSRVLVSNYASSNAKPISVESVTETNDSTAYQAISGGFWSGTGAITTVKLIGDSANFLEHSTASLYIIS